MSYNNRSDEQRLKMTIKNRLSGKKMASGFDL